MRYSLGSHWKGSKIASVQHPCKKWEGEVRTDSLLNIINSLKEVAMFKAARISKF